VKAPDAARVLSWVHFAVDCAYLTELRLKNVVLGRRVELRGRPAIYNHGGQILIGDDVLLWSRDHEYIARNERVRLFASTPEALIEIGARSRLNGASISAVRSVRVGEDCYFAAGTTITDTDGHALRPEERISGKRDEPAPVSIGHRVWLGLRVIVLKGVTIGDDTVVGAGSVVTRDLPPRVICAGQPARVIREL